MFVKEITLCLVNLVHLVFNCLEIKSDIQAIRVRTSKLAKFLSISLGGRKRVRVNILNSFKTYMIQCPLWGFEIKFRPKIFFTISIVDRCEFLYKNDNLRIPELPFLTQKLTSALWLAVVVRINKHLMSALSCEFNRSMQRYT